LVGVSADVMLPDGNGFNGFNDKVVVFGTAHYDACMNQDGSVTYYSLLLRECYSPATRGADGARHIRPRGTARPASRARPCSRTGVRTARPRPRAGQIPAPAGHRPPRTYHPVSWRASGRRAEATSTVVQSQFCRPT
jgi:hypothetical protein